MSKRTIMILFVVAVTVVLVVAGVAIHHVLNPDMPMAAATAMPT